MAMRYEIESGFPDVIHVGNGNAFSISGWCYHSEQRIRKLQLLLDDATHQAAQTGLLRPDVRARQSQKDPRGLSLRSGFYLVAYLPPCHTPTKAKLRLRAILADGMVASKEVGEVLLLPELPANSIRFNPEHVSPKGEPLVAICMATYNPPADLFQRQIDSILAQTHANWVCIITDDASRPDAFDRIRRQTSDSRFYVVRNNRNVGHYNNFEKCLSLAPAEAEFVTLADQDDYWYADKLKTLLSTFCDDTSLVYSDMRIVRGNGTVVSDTYWTTRLNNFTDLASLLLANTITGAASMFRRSLLEDILPFPRKRAEVFHDHWIGCVAMALGKIKYVDRPLYDYVQHQSNVIGHYAPENQSIGAFLNHFAKNARNLRAHYFLYAVKVRIFARLLQVRFGRRMPAAKSEVVRNIATMERSLRTPLWLIGRGFRKIGRISDTLGNEYFLAGSLLVTRFARLFPWWQPENVIQSALASAGLNQQKLNGQTEEVNLVRQKIAPLKLNADFDAERRINLLISTMDVRYIFGGYITIFNLAYLLSNRGYKVRMITTDPCDFQPEVWRKEFKKYEGLEDFLDHVEIACMYDREQTLTTHPEDVFMATSWWTAHIAHTACKQLRKKRFVYLIQEFEPVFYPMGSYAALAYESYEFPHLALFSTELLREYFRENRLGRFSEVSPAGEQETISFENTVTNPGPVTVADLENRSPKRLLFYARPEPHAARNLFELGVMALQRAVADGTFANEPWEFYGIGSLGGLTSIDLGSGCQLDLLPRTGQHEYKDLLRSFDLGMSLMLTPHPSLVPMEMAAAGMMVVTSCFANKSSEQLQAISPNILGVDASIGSLGGALGQAVAGIHNLEARAQGSKIQWSTDWKASFNDQVMRRLEEFLASASEIETTASI